MLLRGGRLRRVRWLLGGRCRWPSGMLLRGGRLRRVRWLLGGRCRWLSRMLLGSGLLRWVGRWPGGRCRWPSGMLLRGRRLRRVRWLLGGRRRWLSWMLRGRRLHPVRWLLGGRRRWLSWLWRGRRLRRLTARVLWLIRLLGGWALRLPGTLRGGRLVRLSWGLRLTLLLLCDDDDTGIGRSKPRRLYERQRRDNRAGKQILLYPAHHRPPCSAATAEARMRSAFARLHGKKMTGREFHDSSSSALFPPRSAERDAGRSTACGTS
jgi:hypothetical protein